jgi:hypothetical protein
LLLTLNLRTRAGLRSGMGHPEAVEYSDRFDTSGTALLLGDMWDNHWCANAAQRGAALARRMNPVVQAARARGVQIIHAPSDCMDFYQDMPQRWRMLGITLVEPPPERRIAEPPLPIDDGDGGCDDPEPRTESRVWTRQHAAIAIEEPDIISDNGAEIYNQWC